ncbi:hypothetical protein BC567DRAFT_216327 [Phyllosticta citribraziliensis]
MDPQQPSITAASAHQAGAMSRPPPCQNISTPARRPMFQSTQGVCRVSCLDAPPAS